MPQPTTCGWNQIENVAIEPAGIQIFASWCILPETGECWRAWLFGELDEAAPTALV
jgi:hypothetical protein